MCLFDYIRRGYGIFYSCIGLLRYSFGHFRKLRNFFLGLESIVNNRLCGVCRNIFKLCNVAVYLYSVLNILDILGVLVFILELHGNINSILRAAFKATVCI